MPAETSTGRASGRLPEIERDEALRSAAAMRRVLDMFATLFEDERVRGLDQFNDVYEAACAVLGREAKEIA